MRPPSTRVSAWLLVLWACSDPALPPAYRSLPVPEARLASEEARGRGRELFTAHCALCHGERGDGRGRRRSPGHPAADLTDPFWHRRASPRSVFHAIREGVPGTPMASWKTLSEEQTWDLVAWVLALEGEAP